jgi:phosphoenolpyruvate-protein kinase (PTS system EI component)
MIPFCRTIDEGRRVQADTRSTASNDSEIVAPIFDERNAAVTKRIAQVIAICRARGRKIGIYGQAPSDYREFAHFLVEQGIDSISLNPDAVMTTTLALLDTEAVASRPPSLRPRRTGLQQHQHRR